MSLSLRSRSIRREAAYSVIYKQIGHTVCGLASAAVCRIANDPRTSYERKIRTFVHLNIADSGSLRATSIFFFFLCLCKKTTWLTADNMKRSTLGNDNTMSSTSTLGNQGSPKAGGNRKKIVGRMFKYAVFDINQHIAKKFSFHQMSNRNFFWAVGQTSDLRARLPFPQSLSAAPGHPRACLKTSAADDAPKRRCPAFQSSRKATATPRGMLLPRRDHR